MAQTRHGSADREAVERIERMLQATAGEDPALRAALLSALGSRQKTADTLWRWVLVGLLVLSTLALVGLLYLVGDANPETQPELALTAFVGLLGGLLGLLIGAPWQGPADRE
jgi:hypothetical protein